MSPYKPPVQDGMFLLRDLLRAHEDWSSWSKLDSLDLSLAEAVLEQAGQLAADVMDPLSRSGDEEGARWENGSVYAPSGYSKAFSTLVQGGWIGLGGDPQFGGQGLPMTLGVLVDEFFFAANTTLWLYGSLTIGAAHCLRVHGEDWIKDTYLPNMYSGKWTGAMALTESHAGTDLGMLRTAAVPAADGTYRLNGTKIFITSGEHDLAENIVHLVLARLPDAPEGVKGISLFMVPKYLVNADGSLGERNGFSSISIEKKMGIHGSATSTIAYEDAKAYLIGEPNRGLRCMFTMMNTARLSVGIQGLGLGDRAYQLASDYVKERLQGRSPTGPINADGPADPIIEHPEIRRTMLAQRAYNEGGRAFAAFAAHQIDRSWYCEKQEEREQAQRFVELLTPIVKAFLTDRAFDSAVLAQNCFGGHGYIRETGIEQIVRDARIAQIYEGTNGIQALDLVKRKVVPNDGLVVAEFIEYMKQTMVASPYTPDVHQACDLWTAITREICSKSSNSLEFAAGAAVDYLDLSGHIIYGWLWARMQATEYAGNDKQMLADFYWAKLMPRIDSLARSIQSGTETLMEPASSWF